MSNSITDFFDNLSIKSWFHTRGKFQSSISRTVGPMNISLVDQLIRWPYMAKTAIAVYPILQTGSFL